MKRLVALVALVLIIAGFLSSGITDTSTSIADTGVPSNELTSNQSKADNFGSPSATIRITMTPISLPDE